MKRVRCESVLPADAVQWITASGCQHFALGHTPTIVQVQQKDGYAPTRRKRLNARSVQTKVARPLLAPWMKQGRDALSLRVHGCEVGTFVTIAGATCPREVFRCGCPAMFLGDDVIGLVGIKDIIFVNETVFASAECTFARFATQGLRHATFSRHRAYDACF